MKGFIIIMLFSFALAAHEQNDEVDLQDERHVFINEEQIMPHKIINNAETEDHLPAFISSYTSIFVSEIGDKTFFVAAIMAMRYNRIFVFIGAASALVLMTLISCVFGAVAFQLLPKLYTQVIVMVLFLFIGIKLIYEWKFGEDHENTELKEVEVEMQELHNKLMSNVSDENLDMMSPTKQQSIQFTFKQIGWQSFYLTFLGEWGDRSQFTTIALAAVHHPWLVFLGGSLGHITCTLIAILSGHLLSDKLGERTVNLIGGILFSVFGLLQLLSIIEGK